KFSRCELTDYFFFRRQQVAVVIPQPTPREAVLAEAPPDLGSEVRQGVRRNLGLGPLLAGCEDFVFGQTRHHHAADAAVDRLVPLAFSDWPQRGEGQPA